MTIKQYMDENNLNRLALVGSNSQGKSYALEQLAKDSEIKNCSICIWTEVKADENIKNSADSTTLISWLNRLIDMSSIKQEIDNKIQELDFLKIDEETFLNIRLTNNLSSYKGIIGAEITTNSNSFNKPGSGEKFLGQLHLISKILEDNTDNYYRYLIVDEPERHLHPSLYVKMGMILNNISKSGIKVIISTHSPVILEYFVEDTNEIVKMKNGLPIFIPTKEELINKTFNYNVYTDINFQFSSYSKIKSDIPTYFNRFILNLVYKSLFCDKIIIAEGYAEDEILKIFFEEYGNKSIINNIDYLIVYGKCFFPWLIDILKSIGVKVLSIHDKDNLDDPKHANVNELIAKFTDSLIVVDPKIENRLTLSSKDKVKSNVIEIRHKYINRQADLISFIEEIYNKVSQL